MDVDQTVELSLGGLFDQRKFPIPGFSAICAPSPSELVFAISRPLVALVLQGQKTIATGARQFRLNAGDSMLITADVPTVSQVTQANIATPYLSLVLNLDLAVVTELAICNQSERADEAALIRIENTDTEVADTALRLMRLLDRPRSLPILQAQTVRELHHWLLAGHHGAALQEIGGVQGNVQRIARAVALLRSESAQPLPVERLSAAAGMSASSFPSTLSQGHFVVTAAVSKTIAVDRSAPPDGGRWRRSKHRCVCGGLRKPFSIHTGVQPHVRHVAGARCDVLAKSCCGGYLILVPNRDH